MFKHRAFQIKVVNTAEPGQPGASGDPETLWTPDQLIRVGREAVKTIVVAAAAFYAVKVTLDTAQEITVKRTPTKK